MNDFQRSDITVGGVSTRIWRKGRSPTAFVFLHGGIPGLTPYANGTHIWGDVLERFADERTVVAFDSLGAGGTGVPTDALTVERMVAHTRGTLESLGITQAHLVGHDLGGLVALALAIAAPESISAVTTVASTAAMPSGDMAENLTLAHPPRPLWRRESQAWALERVSYAHHHIDTTLLDACVAAAEGSAHRDACERMASGTDGFAGSITQAKTLLYERCRGVGVRVPVQIIAGSHDPLGTMDQSLALFRLIAAKQRATHLHVINRTGALPFLEAPATFHEIVAAFADGLGSGA